MSGLVAVAEMVASVLAARPAGIVSDIDGTLSRVTWPPGSAYVEEDAREALRRLASRLEVVAVVSGRSVRDAEHLVGVAEIEYVGNHGLERLVAGKAQLAPEAVDARPAIAGAMEDARQKLQVPGMTIEDKGVGAAFHFRTAPDPASAERQILSALRPIAARRGLRITQGRLVIELRPNIDANKGTALRDIVERHALRSVVFLGDDTTDVDAMSALAHLRAVAGLRGLSVGVVNPETPAAIEKQADALVSGVEGVVALLTALADRLEAQSDLPASRG